MQNAAEGFPLAPIGRHVTDVAVSEDTQSAVQKSIKSGFLEPFRSFDFERAARAFTDDFRGRFPRPDQGLVVDDDRLSIREYEPDTLEVVGRDRIVQALQAHVASWTSIERASWNAFEFLLEPNRKRAFTKVHLQFAGPGPAGERAVLDATIAVQVIEAATGQWEIRRLDLVEGMRVESAVPPFREITDRVGLHFNRSDVDGQLRQDILDTRASLIDSALSVVDWNRDGFWDILVTESMNHSVLFLNDGKGGFSREALPIVDRRMFPSQALFVDLDNDGLEELVTTRVVYLGNRAWMGVYARRESDWVFLPRALEFDNPPGLIRGDAQSITVGDVNGDGLLDLFVAGYENNQSRDPKRFNRFDAHDGDRNLLFINHGALRFTEESQIRGIKGTQYTYVAQMFDFDGDGDLDILEGNDYGRNVMWDNQGDGRFRALKDHPLARDPTYTMGITIGDWNNSGDWTAYVSNMYSHAGNRVVRLSDSVSGQVRRQLEVAAAGNQMFTRHRNDREWREQARPLGVYEAGWAWASLFYDIDNDGDKEIFVANGNTSFRDPAAPDY